MIKGWRLVFYALIAAAVLAIATITLKFIFTERLVKATGDPDPVIREKAARKIMGKAEAGDRQRRKAMEFLRGQPRTVRDNVVWSVEKIIGDGNGAEAATEWLVDLACDLSGDLPPGDADTDTARLAVERVGASCIPVLVERLQETTQRTLEKDTYAHRRAVAARLLGMLDAKEANDQLVHALRDPYELVRQQAAAALARLGTPEAEQPLRAYLEPYFDVLQGNYVCYVRADAYGRIRNDPDRDNLLYGPFVVKVKPHVSATEEDLERQRDSAEEIMEKEERRMAATRERLEKGKAGKVIKTNKGPADLKITKVTLKRTGLEVTDPIGKQFDVIEGEPLEVIVELKNDGPGDIVSDYFVAAYGASPPPKNHVDRPEEGEYKGERAQDNRALVQGEARHLETMYARNVPGVNEDGVDEDESRATMFITLRFNTVEADQIEALRQLKYVGDASAVPALGEALTDRSYTVRSEAAMALQRILQARQTSPEAKQQIVGILRSKGLTSPDPVVRYRAAEALVYAGDAQTAEALQALLLSDADPTVRLVATRALAGTADVERERMLPTLVSRDSGVRLMAPRLFGKSALDAQIARSLLFDQDPEVAREVLRGASRLLTTADLIAALTLPDPAARTLAVQILALREDPAATAALLKSLDDEQGEVRAAAAEGLGALLQQADAPDPAVVARLVKVIESEAGDYVGVPAGEEPEDVATAVITDKRSRAAAAAALVGVTTPEATKALTDAFTDTNPDVLAAIMPAVSDGQLGDQSERLIAIVEDVKMPVRVRQAAILAMWKSGTNGEPALAGLVGLLNDPNDTIKTSAAVALIGLDDSRGEKVLRDQLTSKNADVRRAAATLLATLSDEKVQEIKGIKDEDRDGLNILIEELYLTGSLPVNFRFLCRSLIFLGDQQRVVDRMVEALGDPHPVLRAAGLTVLAELDHPDAAAKAREMLSDPNEVVRAAAAAAAASLRLQDTLPQLESLVTGEHPDPSQSVQDAVAEAETQLQSRS